MQALVTKDNVTISQEDKVHEGEYNVNHINFSFSEEYTNDLVKNAVFAMGDKIYQTSIINNQCNIPSEILSDVGEVFFGVYAYKVNDGQLELRYSPFPTRFTIISGSYNPTAEESQEITPTQFEQYMQALQNGLNDIQNAIDDLNQRAEDGEFDGQPGKDGFSPIVTTTPIENGTRVDITDVEGVKSFELSNGERGKDGITPNLQIGTVTTLEPNEQATVTRTGTDEEPLFNFGIPQGIQGEQGIPGQDGQPGQDGADGKDATINDQNTVEITTDNNITLDQQESVLKLGLNSQLIPKQEAEGTDCTFDDGLESPLYDLGGDGKSEQVVTQGYQLVDWRNNFSKSTGVSFSFTDDILTVIGVPGTEYQSVTYNITDILKNNPGKTINYKDDSHQITNSSSESMAQIAVRYSDGTSTFYRVVCNYKTNQLSSYKIPDDISNINRVDLSIFTNNSSNTDMDNTVMLKKPLLYFDDNDIYEPYTGGQPSPSPDYPQEINSIDGSVEFACIGKNLFNKNSVVNGYLSQSGGIESNPGYKTSDFIKVMPNTSYFLNNTNTKRLKFYDINKNAITSDWDLTSAGSQSFTTLSNTYYLRFSIDINATDINTIQLERGTKATPYEPYIQPNEVTFNLSDEKLMSAKTYNSSSIVQDTLTVDLTTGNYYKEEIFDNLYNITGDEEVQYIEDNTYPYFVIRKASGNAGFVWCNIAKNIVTIANMMKPENNNTFFWNSGSIGFRFDDITSIDDFKNKIKELNQNSHQVYVVQPDSLALLPTTKLLGTLSAEDLAKLKTFKGYNNVTVNTNLGLMNIRFTYGLDIKKYVDNKIAQLSEQLIKGE